MSEMMALLQADNGPVAGPPILHLPQVPPCLVAKQRTQNDDA